MSSWLVLLLLVGQILAGEQKGYWATMLVDSYHVLERESLADGKTSHDTNAFQEGCAADRRFYPKGTRLFVATGASDKQLRGKWFTVDDTHPDTVRRKDKILLRFMTEAKARKWKPGPYKVWVVLP